jgi:GTPase SAR1 family protein
VKQTRARELAVRAFALPAFARALTMFRLQPTSMKPMNRVRLMLVGNGNVGKTR